MVLTDEIKDVWNTYRDGSAEDFYQTQFNVMLKECAEKEVLPFFEKDKKNAPENFLNRKQMTDINKTAAELHAAQIGAKSNNYIFGKDAIDLGLRLDKAKKVKPLLVCHTGKYAEREVFSDNLSVADSGAKVDYQFMYNIEQFDERSQQKLLKLTRKEQEPHQKKLENKKKEAFVHFRENGNNKNLKLQIGQMKQKNENEQRQKKLGALYLVTTRHNIAQACGTDQMLSDVSSEKEESLKAYLKNEIHAASKAIEEGVLPKDSLMRGIFQAQDFSRRYTSKDFNYENKHQRDEHLQRKKNIERKHEYDFGR